jgi:hypothetical protein
VAARLELTLLDPQLRGELRLEQGRLANWRRGSVAGSVFGVSMDPFPSWGRLGGWPGYIDTRPSPVWVHERGIDAPDRRANRSIREGGGRRGDAAHEQKAAAT